MTATADDGKMLSRVAAPEEVQFERQLRPRSFEEYVGQEQAVSSLKVSVDAAKMRQECVDHCTGKRPGRLESEAGSRPAAPAPRRPTRSRARPRLRRRLR